MGYYFYHVWTLARNFKPCVAYTSPMGFLTIIVAFWPFASSNFHGLLQVCCARPEMHGENCRVEMENLTVQILHFFSSRLVAIYKIRWGCQAELTSLLHKNTQCSATINFHDVIRVENSFIYSKY